jgi:hypothetical protein
MPLAKRNLSRDRADFERSLTVSEVDSLVADSQLKVLQTSSPVEGGTWDILNDRLFSKRHDVRLRIYGFYSLDCDLSFLPRLQNVRRFSADCLMQAHGVEHLTSLKELESLSIGIFNLETFDFLENLSVASLRELSLAATKSKKPTLRKIGRFDQLRRLYLEGQQKDLDVISTMPRIEEITLRSIGLDNLDLLKGLKNLWSLDIKLGGLSDLSSLKDMNGIKYLELWQVRGLKDISAISTMRGLQFLFLQSLPHISTLPDLSELTALRRVHLDSMKGLQDVHAIATAPAIEEFMHVCAQGMEPLQYAELLKSRTLKGLLVGFGSEKKNKTLRDLAAQAGIKEYKRSDFIFA